MSPSAVRRPVLRYHGGKWRLAPWVIGHFPPHRVYVEPFGGGASVLIRKPRSFGEVYNDLDDEIVNVFRVLRDPETASALTRALELTPWARDEFFASYEPAPDPVEQARRTISRTFMGFGTSSRRANRTGFRSKAYRQNASGPGDWRTYPPCIVDFVTRLRGVCIENRDALEVIAQQDSPQTLFYVDPPYPVETRSSIRGPWESDRAYKFDLTNAGHSALAATLRAARGMVALSSYPSPVYDALYAGWTSRRREAIADGGRRRIEVLWTNPQLEAAHAGQLQFGTARAERERERERVKS